MTAQKRSARSNTADTKRDRVGKILVLHGPNLNLLGTREPEVYGRTTLADIHAAMAGRARAAGVVLESFQSNSEGELINRVQGAATEGIDFVIINPAGYTHTSVALRDALAAVGVPFIEVHLSNVFARESFRHHSYFSDLAVGVIAGLGAHGYELALEHALRRMAASA
jgi:3-dehydroquinate dehydratase-2